MSNAVVVSKSAAYEYYKKAMGGLSYSGLALPEFTDMSQKLRDAWGEASRNICKSIGSQLHDSTWRDIDIQVLDPSKQYIIFLNMNWVAAAKAAELQKSLEDTGIVCKILLVEGDKHVVDVMEVE